MSRRDQVLKILSAGFLVFASQVFAQDCQSGKTPPEAQEAPSRTKPAVTAARDIAPRDLPAVYSSEADRALKAAKVLDDAPKEFLSHAKAIAVIPSVKKAAFGLGGRWGKGLFTKRDESGQWIPPSFIEIGGGSFGLQIGVQATDLVLVFTDEDAANSLLRGKLTLNGDAAAAAGPVGRHGEAGVDILMNSGILSYSHSKGVFAGVSLAGSVLTIDDTSNQRVYGKYINGDQILKDRRVETNDVVQPFLAALDRRIPASRSQTSD